MPTGRATSAITVRPPRIRAKPTATATPWATPATTARR
jgi:hypothetical protein